MTDSIEYLVQADIDFPMDYQDTHVMIKNHLKLFVLLVTLQLACILANMKFAALNIIICLYLVSYQIWTCITLLNTQFELRAIVDSTDDDNQEVDDQEVDDQEVDDQEVDEGEEEGEGEDEFKQEEHPTDEQPSDDNADDESEVVESIPAPADVPIPVSEDETEPEEPVPVPNLPQVRRRGRRPTKQT
jgi:hypothetical protein